MGGDFLGKGWSFPLGIEKKDPGAIAGIAMAEGEEDIQQAIWIILATAPGERAMRPDFGCGIHNLVFAVDDAATRRKVAEAVRRALVVWEPRIDVLSVDARARDRGELLLINVHYRVRATNNFFNLVYPFYLTRGAR